MTEIARNPVRAAAQEYFAGLLGAGVSPGNVLVLLLDGVSFGCSSTVTGFVLHCTLSTSRLEDVRPSGLWSFKIATPCP
jgi:hypothetical protein